MRVLIMGCGRVGSELSHALGEAGHDVTVIDKRAEAFDRYPPGDHARRIVGLGFDRDVLEEAGIRDADAFIAVSSGDNSNIVSARVALEHYHVPKVIARIFDPRRAEIYERLEHPDGRDDHVGGQADPADAPAHRQGGAREPRAAGELLRVRVPVPSPPGGQAGDVAQRRRAHPDRRRLAWRQGLRPRRDSTMQEGDFLIVMMGKDYMDELDASLEAPAEHH